MAKTEVTTREKGEFTNSELTRPGRTYAPEVDIYETKDGLWLWVDMPGVDEPSLAVHVDEDVLTIEGQVIPDDYKDLHPVYAEYPIGNYRRRFTLSQDLDPEKIRAKMNHGVLEIELPKAAKAKPRKIEVAVG
jgi:HSP20 family molecular chaperone IbpA